MTNIKIRNKLAAEHAGKESPLYPLISARIGKNIKSNPLPDSEIILWEASWWGLDKSKTFQKLGTDEQTNSLLLSGRGLKNEAYFIEKSGLAYSAKMILLAESTDVAQLYALIGADEASHLAWIEPYIEKHDKTQPQSPFITFLSELIEECQPHVLIYLVQIILEGWGLDHYKRLTNGCLNPYLREILRSILKDEALHHRSGIILHNPKKFSKVDHNLITDSLKYYADLVRSGPQGLLVAIDQAAAGGLSATALEDVVQAVEGPGETLRKLKLLKKLMAQPGFESTITDLESANYFTPLSTTAVVKYFRTHR